MYVLGIGFVDLLIFEVHLLDGFRWFMKYPNEKQMVKDSSHVARPMQEELKENLRHEVETCFNAKINRKEAIVIVDKQQDLSYW